MIIKILPPTTLIGMKQEISFAQNTTPLLWKNFMPRRNEIENARTTDLFSVSIYPYAFFSSFDVHKPFEKWAALEVHSSDVIPNGMEVLTIMGGLYLTFIYKGLERDYPPVFMDILTNWLPKNGYQLDDRPFFEILGEQYKNNSPESEEEIWIPIK
jgi:AraC family transcriptional regulator